MKLWLEMSVQELSREHLLDEHRTVHAVIARPLNNLRFNLVRVVERHEEIVEELTRRGYQHHTPISEDDVCNLFRIQYVVHFNRPAPEGLTIEEIRRELNEGHNRS
jgi:DNA-binding winged helix-turn-helix (wHTH) protein